MIDESYDPRPVFYGLAAGLWLVAFLFALMPLEAYEAESFLMAVLCVGASALCVLVVAPLGMMARMIRSPLVWLALGFLGLALVSVGFSEIPFVSFIYFVFFSVFPLSAFIVAASGGADALIKPLAYGLAGVFGALAVSCLVQYFFVPEWLLKGAVSWPLANPNSLAGLLSLGFFASFGWMLAGRNRGQSNAALVLAGLLFAALLTTQSRGALVALVPALAVFLVFARGVVSQHTRCLSALGLGCLLAFIVLSVFAPMGVKSPWGSLESTFSGAQSVLWSRPAIWASAWQIFEQHIWAGTGIGTFFLYYPEVRSAADASTAGLMVHSDPLQFLVELGVLGPVVFYGFILVAVWMSVRVIRGLAEDDTRRVYILAPFCGLMAMVGHAHITFHFHVLSILMGAGALLGFWFFQMKGVPDRAVSKGIDFYEKPFVRLVVAVPAIVVLAIFGQFQVSEILVNRAESSLAKGDMQDYAQAVNRAGKLSANQNARAMISATHVPLGIVQLNAPLLPKDSLRELQLQIDSLLGQAEVANPRLAQIYYTRAEAASYIQPFLTGERASVDIEGQLRYALKIDPLHLASRMKLADLFLRRGEDVQALGILEGGLNWRYKTLRPRLFLEKTYGLAVQLERLDIAERARLEFKRYFPSERLGPEEGYE